MKHNNKYHLNYKEELEKKELEKIDALCLCAQDAFLNWKIQLKSKKLLKGNLLIATTAILKLVKLLNQRKTFVGEISKYMDDA